MKSVFPVVLLPLVLLEGCVVSGTKEPPRRTIRFSSVRAAQVFYSSYGPAAAEIQGVSTEVTPAGSQQVTYPGDGRLHAAVTAADVDANGVITEKEAVLFSSDGPL